jgi:hypothetical protein
MMAHLVSNHSLRNSKALEEKNEVSRQFFFVFLEELFFNLLSDTMKTLTMLIVVVC